MKILSPAGSYDAMVAAVKMGADAVYLGLSSFSARQNAVNFTPESLKDAALYCHKRGVEVFVAFNTLIYENEIEKAKKLIGLINKSMADGIIIQDFGVFEIVKNIAPALKKIASTQMTAGNISGIKFLAENGFDTVVLPRELSYSEISNIKRNVKNIKLEVFAHGAICVCYSGQCLMSSFLGGRSGNRGECAQPCRMIYEAANKKGYLLSPCDLSLISRLEKLEKLGVDSIKIEGRMKGEFYTAAITDVYRRVLDSVEKQPLQEDYDVINATFLRGGYTTGYFDEIKDRRLFNFARNENPYTLEAKYIESEYREKLSPKKAQFKKIPAKLGLEIKNNENIKIKLNYSGNDYDFISNTIPEAAKNAPVTVEKITEQLNKTGNEAFEFSEIDVNIKDKNIFISLSDINNIRREISAFIENLFNAERKNYPFTHEIKRREQTNKLSFYCVANTAFQIKWLMDIWDAPVFASMEIITEYRQKYGNIRGIGLLCPRIAKDNRIKSLNEFLLKNSEIKDILIGNIGYINVFDAEKYNIHGDFALNITNSLAADFYAGYNFKSITASVESSLKNLKNICFQDDSTLLSVVGYGKIPLMITESCLKKNIMGKCHKLPLKIKDKKGEEFIIACEDCEIGKDCGQNTIYNGYPIIMSDKLSDLKQAGVNQVCLRFSDENKAETEEIIRAFKLGHNPLTKFTRGHF